MPDIISRKNLSRSFPRFDRRAFQASRRTRNKNTWPSCRSRPLTGTDGIEFTLSRISKITGFFFYDYCLILNNILIQTLESLEIRKTLRQSTVSTSDISANLAHYILSDSGETLGWYSTPEVINCAPKKGHSHILYCGPDIFETTGIASRDARLFPIGKTIQR